MFPLVREAIAAVMPVERLRYVGLSHFEADECGSLNELLAVAPAGRAALQPGRGDGLGRRPRRPAAARAGRRRADSSLGRHTLQWFDTPHVPHGWDCGLLMDITTGTFFCGDLFTQPGHGEQALTEADILGPSEAFRQPMDYFAHAPQTAATLGAAGAAEAAHPRLHARQRLARRRRRAAAPPGRGGRRVALSRCERLSRGARACTMHTHSRGTRHARPEPARYRATRRAAS